MDHVYKNGIYWPVCKITTALTGPCPEVLTWNNFCSTEKDMFPIIFQAVGFQAVVFSAWGNGVFITGILSPKEDGILLILRELG